MEYEATRGLRCLPPKELEAILETEKMRQWKITPPTSSFLARYSFLEEYWYSVREILLDGERDLGIRKGRRPPRCVERKNSLCDAVFTFSFPFMRVQIADHANPGQGSEGLFLGSTPMDCVSSMARVYPNAFVKDEEINEE